MKDELAEQIIKQLTRWADAQEKLVEIAEEARSERIKLSESMRERFRAGFTAEK